MPVKEKKTKRTSPPKNTCGDILDPREFIMRTTSGSLSKVWHLRDLTDGTCFYLPDEASESTLATELLLYLVGSGGVENGPSGSSVECWSFYENDTLHLSADMVVVPVKTELRILR